MRRAAKIDANQTEIVEAIRREGASVTILAAVGDGVPDLLVGFLGVTLLVEVKDGSKSPSQQALTPDQKTWHSAWKGGPLLVIRSVSEALQALAQVRISVLTGE